jgi:hypothetical protein
MHTLSFFQSERGGNLQNSPISDLYYNTDATSRHTVGTLEGNIASFEEVDIGIVSSCWNRLRLNTNVALDKI